jgi:hypothetical protein
VWEELERQWEFSWPGFAEQTVDRVRQVTSKAWRFVGEMQEISATLADVGLPTGFHAAAVEIYRRLAHFKEALSVPSLEDVLVALEQNAEAE